MYDVFNSNDMMQMDKPLGDVMKKETHRYVFSPTLYIFLCYKALASEEEEERALIGKIPGTQILERREQEGKTGAGV